MKKNLIYMLLLTFSLGLTNSYLNVNKQVKAYDEISDTNQTSSNESDELITTAIDINDYTTSTAGVGRAINLARHEYLNHNNINSTNLIFDSSWSSSFTRVRTDLNQTSSEVIYSNSFDGIVNRFEQSANLASTNKKGYSLFTATAAAKYADSTFDYPSYTYQYYSSYSYKVKSFAYELPNYQTDLETYQRHLSDEYYDDAEMFLMGDLDRTTFFDKYGTQVIAKAIFGGSFDINYSIASSFYDVWDEYYSAITSYLQTSLYSKVSSGSTTNFNVFGNFSFNSQLADEQINYVTRGGSNSIDISHANLQAAFTQWLDTVSSSPKIISVTSDGLIPLWELLPVAYDTQDYKDYFIQQYKLYAASCEDEISDIYEPEIFDITTGVETGFSLLRVGEVTVTDDGIYDQHYDVAYLNETFDLKYNYMRANGYTTVDVYIHLEMREINMGYQIISIYSSEKESDTYLIDSFEYEYEGNSLGDEYGYTIGFVRYSIPINTFINEDEEDCYKVVFRYSARGALADDWANRKVYANIVYFK